MRWLCVILAAVVLTIGYGRIEDTDRRLDLRGIPARSELCRRQLAVIAGHLRDFRKEHGRYPTNDEGLLILTTLADAVNHREDGPWDDPLRNLRITGAGVLTPWGEPYMYENRQGRPARDFAFSAANNDPQRQFSLRVDKRIYLWSLAAKQKRDTLRIWRPRLRNATRLMWLVVSGLLVAYIAASLRGRPRNSHLDKLVGRIPSVLLKGSAVFFGVLVVMFPTVVKTCYEASFLTRRGPELTHDYAALLTKYRDRGVIGEKTYSKLIEALKHDKDYPRW